MTRVTMLVHNALEFDPRVEREAAALARNGYVVTIIAIWEPERTERIEERRGFTIKRVSRRRPGVDALSRFYSARIAWLEAYIARRRTRLLLIERKGRRLTAKMVTIALRLVVRGIRRILRMLPNRTQRWAIEQRMMWAAIRTRPDVIHAHDLNTLAAAARAARLARARLVYDSHEISPGLPSVAHPERVIAYERRWIARAHHVIHTTPMRAQWAAQTYGIATPTVVRNIPDVERNIPPVDIADAVGLPKGTKIILHQGNMSADRGCEQLVEAMDKLDDSFGLVFLGGGRLRGKLEDLTRERGLVSRVRFHAPVPHRELLAWTAGAWCGVSLLRDTCLNHTYSLPNKLFESVAVGVPMIVSSNPEIAAFAAEHGIGEVCDPDDPADIAAAIQRLEPRRDAAAEAARVAGDRFRWENEEATLLALYEALSGGTNR